MKNSIITKSGIKSIKKILVLAIILASNFSFSQGALQVGYTNFGKSSPYFGIDTRVDDADAFGTWANVGGGIYFFKGEKGMEFIPEIHSNVTLLILMLDVSVSTKAVNPGIGINIFNGIKAKFGYNFTYNQDHYRGTTFGLNINIGDNDYYKTKNLKMMP